MRWERLQGNKTLNLCIRIQEIVAVRHENRTTLTELSKISGDCVCASCRYCRVGPEITVEPPGAPSPYSETPSSAAISSPFLFIYLPPHLLVPASSLSSGNLLIFISSELLALLLNRARHRFQQVCRWSMTLLHIRPAWFIASLLGAKTVLLKMAYGIPPHQKE